MWERYLVYGIAFGIAERVLQGAQLHMPEALAESSAIYWISPHGDLGSGASSMSIGDLASGFGDALAPPALLAEAAVAVASPGAAVVAVAAVAAALGKARCVTERPGREAHGFRDLARMESALADSILRD